MQLGDPLSNSPAPDVGIKLGSPGSSWSNDGDDLFAVGSKLYITNWERKLTCFDVATNTTCTGWPALPAVVNTTATGTHRNNLFPRLSAGGAITGICVVGRLTDATCYNLDGSNPTEVSLGSLYNPYSVGINANADVYIGSRVFFPLYAYQNALVALIGPPNRLARVPGTQWFHGQCWTALWAGHRLAYRSSRTVTLLY